MSDQLSLFKPEDEAASGSRAFSGRGPIRSISSGLEDGFAWGTQAAARNMPLPPSDGLAPRSPEFSCTARTFRSPRGSPVVAPNASRQCCPPFLQNFPAIWDERRNEIVKGLRHLETYDLSGKSPAEIWQYMVDARAFHVRAWEIHFDLMYPLTANYLGFYGLCKELGIAAPDIPKFLQGYETQPMKSDRAMWQLANSARGTQVQKLIADTAAGGIYKALKNAPQARLGEGIRRLPAGLWLALATALLTSARRPGSRTRTAASVLFVRCCKATILMRSNTA